MSVPERPDRNLLHPPDSKLVMESSLWAIAIPGDDSVTALTTESAPFANLHVFRVPANGLRVGTLDSLMSLSDDLAKMDVLAEGTVTKIFKQLAELRPDEEPPTIRFCWN